MWSNFFKHIDIQPEHAHLLDGNAADLDRECDKFEHDIEAAGGIQLFIGGSYHPPYRSLTPSCPHPIASSPHRTLTPSRSYPIAPSLYRPLTLSRPYPIAPLPYRALTLSHPHPIAPSPHRALTLSPPHPIAPSP